MKTWQTIAITTLVSLTIGGIYLFSVFEHRNPGVLPQTAPDQNLTPDDVAIVRMKFMTSFDDTVKLYGTSVWMKNGYTTPYFPYQSGHINFSKTKGKISSAQQLDIKKVIKALPPDQIDDGISHGTRQAFAVFALPNSPDLYATVIGAFDGSQEEYFCDVLFYYDDPHTIYDNWPKNIWAAIDAHQVIPGMNELQTQMSVGHEQHVDDSGGGQPHDHLRSSRQEMDHNVRRQKGDQNPELIGTESFSAGKARVSPISILRTGIASTPPARSLAKSLTL